MEIGVCTTDFYPQPVEPLFKKIAGYGFTQVQFNFGSMGGEDLPERVDDGLVKRMLDAEAANGLRIIAVNGTFNIIHPDRGVRERGIERFAMLAEGCVRLGCGVLSLCTGTRDPEDMWKWHPGTESADAWDDMMRSMEALVAIAQRYDLCLAVETEASNVISTPERARKLLDAFCSPHLKIILDCANLFHQGEAHPENVHAVISRAFKLLGNDIVLAHGKDIAAGPGIRFVSPGRGIVDYDYFLKRLRDAEFAGAMVLHGIKAEADVPSCVDFIRGKIADSGL